MTPSKIEVHRSSVDPENILTAQLLTLANSDAPKWPDFITSIDNKGVAIEDSKPILGFVAYVTGHARFQFVRVSFEEAKQLLKLTGQPGFNEKIQADLNSYSEELERAAAEETKWQRFLSTTEPN